MAWGYGTGAANRQPIIFTEEKHNADRNALKKIHEDEERKRRERARMADEQMA